MHKLLLAIILTTLTTGSICNASNTTTPSASEILQRTAKTYATCISYRDTGTATATTKSKALDYKSILDFMTVFTRPNQFRFEYNTAKDSIIPTVRHIVWTSGDTAYWWWTIDSKVTKADSLEMALAAATGVSLGSAHNVPQLLMPNELFGLKITDIKKPKLLVSETLDGTDCFKISGTGVMDNNFTLWIAKRDYLIRKTVDKMIYEHTPITFTITYKPKLNVTIPASDFESGVLPAPEPPSAETSK